MTGTRKIVLVLLVMFFCTGFDQITKDIAQEKLADSPTISLLNDIIRIQYVENPGVMLGLGSNLPEEVRFVLFVVLNALITLVTLIYAFKTHDLHLMQLLGLLFVVSGGIGNLLDRLLNNGAAIDFMNIGIGSLRTGIFNGADIFIVAGVVLFMIFTFRTQRKEMQSDSSIVR